MNVPDSKELFAGFVAFVREYPNLFPRDQGKSWSPTISAFFVALGRELGCEPRCGDLYAKLTSVCQERQLASFSGKYAAICNPWNVNGLLDIDVAWVPPGFTVPKNFSQVPIPVRAEILLAVEHEDESTLYRDGTGTNLNVVLDEIRKIGNVRSHAKVISYVSSRGELVDEDHIQRITREIQLIPSTEHLTKQWLIIGLGKYEAPQTRKRYIISNSGRQLYCKGTVLNEYGDAVHIEEQLVPFPI